MRNPAHDERVAAARELEGVMQSRAIGNRARHLLGENFCAPCFRQCVALQSKILIYGRNAGIANQHRFRCGVTGDGWRCNQGLRMKDAGEDLLHVSVIPCGHFATPLEAGL